MKIEWVNHASYVLHQDDISLICDPWIEGYAFNNGWSLLSASRFTYDDFARITHIWFSHEHPDHFSPPNLSSIPETIRRNITVLYQEAHDRKVVRFCEKLRFAHVVELQSLRAISLAPNLSLMCGTWGGDSWLYVVGKNHRVLNINDCVIESVKDVETIKNAIGPVDILLTQFSYAQFEGNRYDRDSRERAAARKLQQIEWELAILQPKIIIPFASFIWFSHTDNFYMNDCVNRISDVYLYILKTRQAEAVVLYPGDVWTVGHRHASDAAIKKYESDYSRLANDVKLVKPLTVEAAVLIAEAERFLRRAFARQPRRHLRSLDPIRFFVTDLQQTFRFSFRDGLVPEHVRPAEPDLSLSSDSLRYCFAFDWGFNTLHVNGCFEIHSADGFRRFRAYGRVGNMMNSGMRMGFSWKRILRALPRKVLALRCIRMIHDRRPKPTALAKIAGRVG